MNLKNGYLRSIEFEIIATKVNFCCHILSCVRLFNKFTNQEKGKVFVKVWHFGSPLVLPFILFGVIVSALYLFAESEKSMESVQVYIDSA